MRAIVSILVAVVLTFPHTDGQVVEDKGCCIVICMDESTSMNEDNFKRITNFTAELIDALTSYGQPDGQLAGVIKFATNPIVVFKLGFGGTDREIAKKKVLEQDLDGGITNTHLAIDKLCELLNDCPGGHNKVGVIITDGNSDDQTASENAATACKNNDTILFVVGIGSDINHKNLSVIATVPEFYFPIASFETLITLKETIVTLLCKSIVPTTTTTLMTTTTQTTTPVPTTGECLKCEYINGLYIFPSAKYCYVFHTCINYYQAYSHLRPCPFGQFFDPSPATCRPARYINCTSDPCKVAGTVSYPNHMNCRGYFVCNNERTDHEECCPLGQWFVEGNGCVVNASCTDDCPPSPSNPECVLRPYAVLSGKYEENLGGGRWILRDCPSGTSFVMSTCRCSAIGPLTPDPGCQHRLYLPLTRNVQDYRRRKWVTNSRPQRVRVRPAAGAIGNRAAQFTGKNRLLVKGYANSYWGDKLVIRTKFLETNRVGPPAGIREVLFGNGDCGKGASLTVKYNRNTNRVTATIVTKNRVGNEMTYTTSVAPVSAGAWKNVELRYDGNTLTLTVDNLTSSVPATGKIARRQQALQIGSGCQNNAEYFTGFQNQFYVYPCLPP